MSVQRFTFKVSFGVFTGFELNRHLINEAKMKQDEQGEYVRYDDYKHLSDYCDHLVQFSKMPCLPKDLEVLRDANARLAEENLQAHKEIEAMMKKLADQQKIIDQMKNLLQNTEQ